MDTEPYKFLGMELRVCRDKPDFTRSRGVCRAKYIKRNEHYLCAKLQ